MVGDRAEHGIIDVDVHIFEDLSELAEFADGTLRRILAEFRGVDRWFDAPGYTPLTQYDPAVVDDLGRQVHLVSSPEVLRRDLDQRGTDAALIFTSRFLALATRPEPDYPAAVIRAYNRYISERWVRPEQGIYGAILVAPQNVKASVSEVERYAGRPGLVAVCIPIAGIFPLLGHRDYDPIYAAAQAAGLPVVLQGCTLVHPAFPCQFYSYATALAKQALAKPFAAAANLVSLITEGVFARFPGLNVVFTECGVSWALPLLWRLDQEAAWCRHEVAFYGEGRLSHAVRDRLYFTTHRLEEPGDGRVLEAVIGALGAERVLFASDWPHFDADDPGRVLKAPLPDSWKRRILFENTERLFGIRPSGSGKRG
jgi:predicted TIM-barrel fold metal-dependent hydrolase